MLTIEEHFSLLPVSTIYYILPPPLPLDPPFDALRMSVLRASHDKPCTTSRAFGVLSLDETGAREYLQ